MDDLDLIEFKHRIENLLFFIEYAKQIEYAKKLDKNNENERV